MAINNVGSYTNYTTVRSGAQARPAAYAPAPQATTLPASYTPTPPAGGTVAPQSGGLGLGRLASWAGGAFGAWKLAAPLLGRSPGGLVIGGILGAGAFAGNWVYNKLTGGGAASAAPTGGGGAMRYASWAGGAGAAWKWVMPLLGRSPGALVTTGVLGAGAFAGNWIYNKLTGR
jgi:hypothetical protein